MLALPAFYPQACNYSPIREFITDRYNSLTLLAQSIGHHKFLIRISISLDSKMARPNCTGALLVTKQSWSRNLGPHRRCKLAQYFEVIGVVVPSEEDMLYGACDRYRLVAVAVDDTV